MVVMNRRMGGYGGRGVEKRMGDWGGGGVLCPHTERSKVVSLYVYNIQSANL